MRHQENNPGAGSAERQLSREEDRIVKEGLAKGTILAAAAESRELLARLEATHQRSRQSDNYKKFHDALARVSRLNGKSTLRESQEALDELQKAAGTRSWHRRIGSCHWPSCRSR